MPLPLLVVCLTMITNSDASSACVRADLGHLLDVLRSTVITWEKIRIELEAAQITGSVAPDALVVADVDWSHLLQQRVAVRTGLPAVPSEEGLHVVVKRAKRSLVRRKEEAHSPRL